MPKIYEYLGLIFFFYSDEHLPIHVHVSFAEYESKLELEFENGKLKEIRSKNVRGRLPLSSKELQKATKFIKKYYQGIVEKWTTFFVKNKKVRCEIITTKIK